ncbi:MAG: PorT family protein [Flavobacteriales bacterium]|nr:PorT family protein [Flavobacteriales bacterium]NQX99431.1 PorT family protein [Flavobacteriales bacterium]
MHKKIFILILPFILFSNVYGQRETTKNLAKFDHRFMHFGFLLGINSANFVVDRFPPNVPGSDSLFVLEPHAATGFNLGIISAMHLNEYFSLRFTPNLSFASRSLKYRFETLEGPKEYIKEIESTLINFPLAIKYKSVRINNFSAYILLGAAYTIDLASNVGHENVSKNPNDIIVAIKKGDYVGEIGFGTDFYLEYFKFGIELKMSYGIRDLLDHDNTQFSEPINTLRSKIFMLSFTFEG